MAEDAFPDLQYAYERHYQPMTTLELSYVHKMALCEGYLRGIVPQPKRSHSGNLDSVEALAGARFGSAKESGASLARLDRCQVQLERVQKQARATLLRLQADRSACHREHLPVLGARLQALRCLEQPVILPNEPKPLLPSAPASAALSLPMPLPPRNKAKSKQVLAAAVPPASQTPLRCYHAAQGVPAW